MTAGTVVIAGGILATVILLTIVAVLCYCRLQYYCCRREETDKEEEEEETDVTAMSNYRTCPSAEHLGEPDMASSTFLTEVNGPAAYLTPPLTRKPARSYDVCPSCTRQPLPFYLPRPERMRNGGGHFSYRTVQQQELDLPADMASFHHKLNLIRSVTMREVVTHSISTDV